mgnify:FL=1
MSDNNASQALKEFIGETEEIVGSLNLDLMTLSDAIEEGDADPDLINGIFRGAHSVKGLAGMFGFDDISQLAHRMENLLDSLRLGKVAFNQSLLDTLFYALEQLTRLINGKSTDEQFTFDLSPVFNKIEQVLEGDSKTDDDPLLALGIGAEILNVLTEYEEHRLLENVRKKRHIHLLKIDFDLSSFDQDLAELTQILKQQGEVISTLPSVGDIGERIAFQILYGSDLMRDGICNLLDRDDLEISCCGESPQAAEAESFVLEAPEANSDTSATDTATPVVQVAAEEREGSSSSLRSISRTVRVDIDKLDLLMNIVGELVLSKGAIATLADRLKAEVNSESSADLIKATRSLERRLDELQKGVMDVRMVPIGQLFEKMTRIVRRVSNEQGKKVDLKIQGAETELDKLIIEDVSDPLMHIIRNSIDHGLETPVERRAEGKPEKGTILLSAAQKGNHVVIEVRDDGRGIDPEYVRRKAIQKGLVEEDQELSSEEIRELLFMPGFSTRDEVSDLSGRGVGMDVVKNNIAELAGMIGLASDVGQGTVVTLTLPITLAIIKALIVRVGPKTYAIPINSVLETLMLDVEEIRTIEKCEVIELRQTTVPLLRLDQIFGYQATVEANDAGQKLFVAVVGLAEKKMGFVVDELLGQQDVVIKSLGKALSFIKGIAGAAELGNQKTILVLDVAGLMNEAIRNESALHV